MIIVQVKDSYEFVALQAVLNKEGYIWGNTHYTTLEYIPEMCYVKINPKHKVMTWLSSGCSDYTFFDFMVNIRRLLHDPFTICEKEVYIHEGGKRAQIGRYSITFEEVLKLKTLMKSAERL